jgi:hypothetical protein
MLLPSEVAGCGDSCSFDAPGQLMVFHPYAFAWQALCKVASPRLTTALGKQSPALR